MYVICNVGTFGPNTIKIGMTRRLEPLDRVRELGDASVPFLYDVHALFFSDDAVTWRTSSTGPSRTAASTSSTNAVSSSSAPAEVRTLLEQQAGGLLELTEKPVAPEYHQSKAAGPTS